MMNKRNRKGFTLAELLIVVAIIAVLTAIAIPVFTSQLEKSREATDLANIRSAYAQIVVHAIEDNAWSKSERVTLKQQTDGWATTDALSNLYTVTGGSDSKYVSGSPEKGGYAHITWIGTSGSGSSATNVDGHAKITFNTTP